MNITKIEFDLENGFAWASTEKEENVFQVCLVQRKDEKGFKREINKKDCGHNDGICGNYNEKAQGDSDAVDSFLPIFIKAASKAGFKIT